MDLTKTVSFDYGNIYAYESVNINTGREWLIKINGSIGIIGTIDVSGEYITPTPSWPKLSNIDLLNLSIIMSLIAKQYKQLQTT